ncbi:hypothetical protein LINPERHAP2_LOCUS609 [Linum perenne]
MEVHFYKLGRARARHMVFKVCCMAFNF